MKTLLHIKVVGKIGPLDARRDQQFMCCYKECGVVTHGVQLRDIKGVIYSNNKKLQ